MPLFARRLLNCLSILEREKNKSYSLFTSGNLQETAHIDYSKIQVELCVVFVQEMKEQLDNNNQYTHANTPRTLTQPIFFPPEKERGLSCICGLSNAPSQFSRAASSTPLLLTLLLFWPS